MPDEHNDSACNCSNASVKQDRYMFNVVHTTRRLLRDDIELIQKHCGHDSLHLLQAVSELIHALLIFLNHRTATLFVGLKDCCELWNPGVSHAFVDSHVRGVSPILTPNPTATEIR